MIYRESQRRIFKDIGRREWIRQNNLRKPYENEFRVALKRYYTDLGNDIYKDYIMDSQLTIDYTLQNYYDRLQNIFRFQYKRIANIFRNYFLGREVNVKDINTDFEVELDLFIANNVGTLVSGINETTRKKILQAIANGYDEGLSVQETSNLLRNTIVAFGLSRALTIARTEVHRTASFANEMVASSMNLSGTIKEWVSVNDERTRLNHVIADGQKVNLENDFEVGGDLLQYPADPTGSPQETINCRCVVVYTTPDFIGVT